MIAVTVTIQAGFMLCLTQSIIRVSLNVSECNELLAMFR